jgi:SAM-dependent methyltransferase
MGSAIASSSEPKSSKLQSLVAALPELYQPIWGHPELSRGASRPCQDRLTLLIDTCKSIGKLVGRKIRVLDLGCAQGYFSLGLAEIGAEVHGVDLCPENIAVCEELAKEHPELNISFEVGRAEAQIRKLSAGDYDIVLGLSIFHHLIHESSVDEVRYLLEQVGRTCGGLLVELALSTEPLYWANQQPSESEACLVNFPFRIKLAEYATHLSEIKRPLYFASYHYWVLGEQADKFDSWTDEAHALSKGTHEASRRYYFGAKTFAKTYQFSHARGEYNKQEYDNEIKFAKTKSPGFRRAKMLASGQTETQGWIVYSRLKGVLLLDIIQAKGDWSARKILADVLGQLAKLQERGLYHADLRVWNILIDDRGSTWLIDYGAISPESEDVVWPGNLLLSLLIFVYEISTGIVRDPTVGRSVSISPYRLPEPFRSWAVRWWSMDPSQVTFKLLHDTLDDLQTENASAEKTLAASWAASVENILDKFISDNAQTNASLSNVREKLSSTDAEIVALGKERDIQAAALRAELAQARAKLEQAAGELGAARAEKEALAAEREKVGGELAASHARLEQMAGELGASHARLEQMAGELGAAHARLEQAAGELGAARAEKNSLEEALAHQTTVAQHLSAERDALREKSESSAVSLQQAQKSLEETGRELQQIHQSNDHYCKLAALRQQRIDDILHSTCWRVTAPLRSIKVCLSREHVEKPRSIYHQDPLGHAMRYVLKRPTLRKSLRAAVRLFPGFERKLIAKRAAQLRNDFMAACERSTAVRIAQVDTRSFDLSSPRWLESDDKDRTVEEILSRIRSELG